jgi:hypothetical protein
VAYLDDSILRRLVGQAAVRQAAVPPEAAARSAALREAGSLDAAWDAVGVTGAAPPPGSYGRPIARDRQPEELEDAGWRALLEDLRQLDAAAIARDFPRDRRGQLVLGETVLLRRYPARVPATRGKEPWLVARSPGKRSQPQRIHLLLDVIPGGNYAHRWDGERHRWDVRAAAAGATERWGVADLPLPMLDAEDRSARIAELERRLSGAAATVGLRAGLAILLLDEGRFVDALARFDVELADEVLGALAGDPIPALRAFILGGHPGLDEQYLGAAARGSADARAGPWRAHLQAELWTAAPWRFAGALAAVEAAGPRPRRGRRALRLSALPWGTGVKRPALFLTAGARGPRLELQLSGSSAILAHAAWKRPPELDFVRFGIARTWPRLDG